MPCLPNAHLFRGLEAPASGCRPLPAKSGNRETAELVSLTSKAGTRALCPGPRLTCSLVSSTPNQACPNAGAKVMGWVPERQTPGGLDGKA